jgi:DNA-binding response OmpR family regulator
MAGQRVLVIDDSPTIVRVVQLVLTKAGFVVDVASDGDDGLAAARAERPDLILLDFVMPRLNGYQVCRELAADPVLRDVPVVLMSAKGDQVGERFVKVMGIVDYITKPFSPEAITAVVQHTVTKYGGDAGRADPTQRELTDGGNARTRALAALRSQLTDRIAARVAALFALADAADGRPEAGVPTDGGAIADTVRSALDDDALGDILAQVDPVALTGGPSLAGELRVCRWPRSSSSSITRSSRACCRSPATPPASTCSSAAAGSIRPWASGWPTICGSAATSSTAS